jgi:hypothetical protein
MPPPTLGRRRWVGDDLQVVPAPPGSGGCSGVVRLESQSVGRRYLLWRWTTCDHNYESVVSPIQTSKRRLFLLIRFSFYFSFFGLLATEYFQHRVRRRGARRQRTGSGASSSAASAARRACACRRAPTATRPPAPATATGRPRGPQCP